MEVFIQVRVNAFPPKCACHAYSFNSRSESIGLQVLCRRPVFHVPTNMNTKYQASYIYSSNRHNQNT